MSLGLGFVALSGIWVAAVPALLLAAWALVRVKPAVAKGQGMAIAAFLIALLAGSCSYVASETFRDAAHDLGKGVLLSLKQAPSSSEDAIDPLEKWLTEEAREANIADDIRARYQAAEAAMGPSTGAIDLGSPVLGMAPLLAPPPDAEEVGASGNPWEPPDATLWIRATFRDGTLVLALVLGSGDMMDAAKAVTAVGETTRAAAVLGDVRFFRIPSP